MNFSHCRVCGKSLDGVYAEAEQHDGLCSRLGGDPKLTGCYGSFVDFAKARGLEVRERLASFTSDVIAWHRTEVQVAFDEWLELGAPQWVAKPEEIPF